MRFSSLVRILRALDKARARYLVAGGVAVNAHGYQRMTKDLDLVLDLSPGNVAPALEALRSLGYSPVVPVKPQEFADPDRRREWHEQRNMEVFSLTSEAEPGTTVDLFVRNPFPFDEEYDRAMVAELAPGLEVPFVSIETLIAMKEATGRPRDRDDAEHLRSILELKQEQTDE